LACVLVGFMGVLFFGAVGIILAALRAVRQPVAIALKQE
jgi:hypothetical protein